MKKAFIIIAVVLVVAGLAVMAGVMIAVRFDFGKFKKTNTVTNTYAPEGPFTSVDIDTDTAECDFVEHRENLGLMINRIDAELGGLFNN